MIGFFKRNFLWIILLLVGALWGYVQYVKYDPCQTKIVYAVGSFDTRFNISKTDFIRSIESATHIWENAVGKDLFVNSAEVEPTGKIATFFRENIGRYFTRGPVTVNLVYDERQKNAVERNMKLSSIDETKQDAESIKKEFTALQARYEKSKTEYQALLAEYKQRKVDWNTLEEKRLEVNSLADASNALVNKYDFLVRTVNATIQTVNKDAGQEFEEGQYVSDVKGERINIYEFGSKAILERLLAHELGHALGLDHNENPNSIMYYLNSSKNVVPTKEDVAGLKGVCMQR